MRDGKTVSQGFGGADTVLRDGKTVSQVLWRCRYGAERRENRLSGALAVPIRC